MWLVWWLRWHGARLLAGEWKRFEKGAGQPARVRVKVEQSQNHRRSSNRNS
jgi:hypothetical protein